MVGIVSLSKYAFKVKCKTMSAEKIHKQFKKCFSLHLLLSFFIQIMERSLRIALCRIFAIKWLWWVYSEESDVFGYKDKLKDAIRHRKELFKTCSQNGIPGKWTLALDRSTYNYNNCLHSNTKSTSFYLMHFLFI